MEEKIQAAIDAWQNDPDANPHFPEDGEQTLAQAIAQALSDPGVCVGADATEIGIAVRTAAESDEGLALVHGSDEDRYLLIGNAAISCLKTRTVEEVRREYLEELVSDSGEFNAALAEARAEGARAGRELVGAAAALFRDMVIRARMNAWMNDGEVIVEAGRGVWERFCDALGEEVTTSALANTPEEPDDDLTTAYLLGVHDSKRANTPDGWRDPETISSADDLADGRLLPAVVDGEIRAVRYGKTSHVPLYGWCLADQGAEEFDLCRPSLIYALPQPPEVKE
jgi:hypothetical protein